MKKKQLILLVVWFACYLIAMQFFRFKFGANEISAVFAVVGIPVIWFFGRPSKSNSK